MAAKPIYQTTRSRRTSAAITAIFDGLGKRVFSKKELVELVQTNRKEWNIIQNATPEDIISNLVQTLPLRRFTLRSDNYAHEFLRYLWREPEPLEVVASIRSPKSYLCHSSALFIHGLLDRIPQQLCVNYEQSAKPRPSGITSQDALDRAFRGRQRQSAFVFNYEKHRLIVLSGKHTDGLGVEETLLSTGVRVNATNLERSLIDATVRPSYVGGVEKVLDAYRRAREAVSVSRLLNILEELDHVYPYHQSVGFYMQRAGFQNKDLGQLKDLGLNWDFYLAHELRGAAFDKGWRIYHPKNL